MEAVTRPRWRVTDEQLREAEAGLRRLLRAKGFRRDWIEAHAQEVMSQARTDFAARLAAERVEDTVSLLVVIAYRRALKILNAERRAPKVISIDTVFHLADEKTSTPEELALADDRRRRLVKAMAVLPEREKRLLAFVYFHGMELQEAGRRLGWAKASATRHHQAALEKLKALVGERNLLSWEIGIPAYVVAGHPSRLRAGLTWMEGAAESLRDAAVLGSGRLRSLAETGNAVATGGGGRATAGVCAVAVGSCIAAATGALGPGIVGLQGDGHPQRQAPTRRAAETAKSAPNPPQSSVSPADTSDTSSASGSSDDGKTIPSGSGAGNDRRAKAEKTARSGAKSETASTQQTINEFGVERGEVGSEPVTESAEEAAPAKSAAPASSASPRSKDSSAGSEVNSEFGM